MRAVAAVVDKCLFTGGSVSVTELPAPGLRDVSYREPLILTHRRCVPVLAGAAPPSTTYQMLTGEFVHGRHKACQDNPLSERRRCRMPATTGCISRQLPPCIGPKTSRPPSANLCETVVPHAIRRGIPGQPPGASEAYEPVFCRTVSRRSPLIVLWSPLTIVRPVAPGTVGFCSGGVLGSTE